MSLEDGLRFHYVNPKFAGLAWAIDRKKNPANQKKKKLRRRRNKTKKAYNPHEKEVRALLKKFWPRFESACNSYERIKVLKSYANPGWKRVSDELRKGLRRQYLKRYSHLLKDIDEHCGVCGNYVWREKHHVIPLSHGGINEDINLLAICLGCHDEIHPWMKQ